MKIYRLLNTRLIIVLAILLLNFMLGMSTQTISAATVRYEAETAALTGVQIASGRGSSNNQYVDFQNAAGDAIEWTVNAADSGSHLISIRYAQGSAPAREVAVQVNGNSVDVDFPPTADWNSWENAEFTAPLNAGNNSIRIEAIGNSGGNFDSLDVTDPDVTSPPNSNRLEAESADLVGVSVISGNGASNGQYADFQNRSGDSITWKLTAPTAGQYAIKIAYALGASAERPVDVTVNGRSINMSFPSTGSWSQWRTVSTVVSLSSGQNTVQIGAIGSSGANFDYLESELNSTSPQPPPTQPTQPALRYRLNFSDSDTPAPSGWLRDNGQPYQSGRGDGSLTFGWIDEATNDPIDITQDGRNRAPSPDVDVYRETFVHMNHPRRGTTASRFEFEIPNGRYRVLVQVGDVDNEGSDGARHVVNVEGTNVIDHTRSSGTFGVKNGTAVITVNDGRITFDQSGGNNTKIHLAVIESAGSLNTPAVLDSTPADGQTGVSINTSISANFLHLPNRSSSGATSIDNSTINGRTVKLFEGSRTTAISGSVNGTGGGDAINFTPSQPLKANTRYRYQIDGVRDLAGVTLLPFTAEFITGSDGNTSGGSLDQVAFDNVGSVASGARYSSLTIGPDGKLYGLKIDGEINRWTINSNGTLQSKQTLTGLTQNGPRLAIGLAFAPDATANNLVAYVTHSSFTFSGGPAWDGNLSRLSGSNLQNEQLLVTNLPRSVRDHLTNSIAFRPGEPNALYFLQGSNSAGGRPDGAWGNRPERLLTAALLRLDLNKLPSNLPLDAKTSTNQSVINNATTSSPTMSDGTYNPYDSDAPLTLYATGIRNAYDLVWHSNGQAYIPTNGTGGGSLSPASVTGTRRPDGTFYSGQSVPAIGPNEVQRDWLFRVNPADALSYYGHPNPFRGEYVLNRGNIDANQYPSNINPDSNYRGAAFDFEFNKSPNGVIEYKNDAHNGALRGVLLVVRYSGGSDIIALRPNNSNGDIGESKIGIPGLTGFVDPLELIEDSRNGNLYVSDYGTSSIILLRPTTP